MNEQQNIEIVKSGYQAFATGNIQALLGLFADDIEWRVPNVEGSPYETAYDGREATAGFFALLDETEDIAHFEPSEFIAQGEKVVVLGSIQSNVKATGRQYASDWVHIFTLRNEKIVAFNEFIDNLAMSKAFQKAASAG